MSAFARTTDPSTSHDAAASIRAALPHIEVMIMESLEKAGPDGKTLDEIIDDTGIDKVTISPRLRPLCRKDLVIERGKRMGKANRYQTVWVAIAANDNTPAPQGVAA